MSNDERIRQEANALLQEYTVLQRYIEELSTYLNNINASIAEALLARKSIEELSKSKHSEIMVSLDRNGYAFVKATVRERDRVLVSIGSDYYIYTSPEKALSIINKRIEELEESRKNIEKEMSKILSRIEQIKQQLAALQETVSKQEIKESRK